MITVRFSNGFSIQYNLAHYSITRKSGSCDLYTRKDGQWVATVPNVALVEAVSPCRVYNAIQEPVNTRDYNEVLRQIRLLRQSLKKKRTHK